MNRFATSLKSSDGQNGLKPHEDDSEYSFITGIFKTELTDIESISYFRKLFYCYFQKKHEDCQYINT